MTEYSCHPLNLIGNGNVFVVVVFSINMRNMIDVALVVRSVHGTFSRNCLDLCRTFPIDAT